jgi:hypothetical protein
VALHLSCTPLLTSSATLIPASADCNVYDGVSICVPSCYNVVGSSHDSSISAVGPNAPGFTSCDFSTLMCTDGKQLTGCRVQGTTGQQIHEVGGGGVDCGVAQGDGRDTGAAVPSGASSASSFASSRQASASAVAGSDNSSPATTSAAANSAAAASASTTPKSNSAADVKSQAVGAFLAVGVLAGMLF